VPACASPVPFASVTPSATSHTVAAQAQQAFATRYLPRGMCGIDDWESFSRLLGKSLCNGARQNARSAKVVWHENRIHSAGRGWQGAWGKTCAQVLRSFCATTKIRNRLQSKHSKRKQLQKKREDCCSKPQCNRTTLMQTLKEPSFWELATMLLLPALQAYSTTFAPLPPSMPKLLVTLLPAEILQINTRSSQLILRKAQAWLESLSLWSSSATFKSVP